MKYTFSRFFTKSYLLFFFIFSIGGTVVAQDKEFWFAAPDDSYEHGGCDRPTFLMVSSMELPATIEIYIGSTLRRKVTIPPNSFHKEDFSTSADMILVENSIADGVAGTMQNKGIYIKSDNPVTAYYQVNGSCSKDIFTLKGERALGKHFFTPFQTRYGPRSVFTDAYNHFVIVATEDNTSVTIKTNTEPNPTSGTGGGSIVYRPASEGGNVAMGTPFTITLNKGQTYTVRESVLRAGLQSGTWWAMDKPTLSGTEVTANQPIAITVAEPGTTMATTLPAYPSTDLLGDQIVPVEGLGTNYIVVPGFKSGSAEEWVYLMATEDNTTITVYKPDGTSGSFTFNKGQHWTYLLGNDGLFFLADKPTYCYHQSAADTEMGAAILPSMFSISSRKISFYKQSTGVDHTYLFLIFRKNAENGFTINGSALTIPTANIKSIPSVNDWVYAKVDISSTKEGLCVIENSKSAFALGIFSYLTTTTTSYGFMSEFGYFKFTADTTYKCIGDDITLDAGYASSYAWELPDGSTASTSNVTSSLEGWYKVTVNQDTYTIKDSTYVKERFGDLNTEIVGSRFREPGETYKYHVNFRPEYIDNVTYEWNVTNGILNQITPDTIEVTWTNDGIISLLLQDTILGCSKDLYLPVTFLPDNIDDADCVIDRPETAWGIQESLPMNTTLINNYGLRMIGDIDHDGVTDIIAYSPYNPDVYGNRGFEIFYFDGSLKHKSSLTFPGGVVTDNRGSAAIARFADTTYIIVPGRDGYLYAYNVNGVEFWHSTVKYGDKIYAGTVATANAVNVGVADFNNDGVPEIYAGNKIYSISDGSLVCDGGANNKGIYQYGIDIFSTSAVDIDGDGKLELIAGTQIYDVDIAAGTMTIKNGWQLPASELPANTLTEGQAMAVDMDNDGVLEVVVISANGTYGVTVLVWKPQPDGGSKRIGSYAIAGTGNHSTPMIGNIDDTPYPEIVFITNHVVNTERYMYALCYDESLTMGQRIVEKWRLDHTDGSGATGATLFDFNQSGTAEIVYRDEKSLRIFDGSGTSAELKAEFDNVTSPTVREYPIVADIDNDGQAEIIVTGALVSGAGTENGYLRIFKAGTDKSWAPARKVWNQYTYNAVNVNEDLTIPRYPLNPAIAFPANIRPYNNFLQQQTILNRNGTPLWLAPDGQMIGTPTFNYDVLRDSMVITIDILNNGDAAFQAPFYISVYHDAIGGTPRHTVTYDKMIMAGESITVTFGIGDFKKEWFPFDNIIIQINDNGDGFNHQAVCDSTYKKYELDNIIASDDYELIFTNSINNILKVADNDMLPAGCSNPVVQLLPSSPHAGSVVVVNDSELSYTPVANVFADTIFYRIHCGDISKADVATVYIKVIDKPDNISEAECVIEPAITNFTIAEFASYNGHDAGATRGLNPMSTPLVADLDVDGVPEILLPIMHRTRPIANRPWMSSDGLFVVNVKDGTKRIISTADFPVHGQSVAIADVDQDGASEVFIQSIDGKIYCYDGVTGNAKPGFIVSGDLGEHFVIHLADINNDEIPEIIAGNYIFNAQTGALLLTFAFEPDGTAYGNPHALPKTYAVGNDGYYFMPAVGDIDGDGDLEIIAGSTVYDIEITNANGTSGNSLKSIRKVNSGMLPPATQAYLDGPTVLLDFDLDGQLDVCVIGYQKTKQNVSSELQFYVWNPRTSDVIAYAPKLPATWATIPYVGDLDGNGYPDFAFATMESSIGMISYQYDDSQPGNIKVGNTKPAFAETSGFTVFDFNQDRKSEIVYRGTNRFYIVDGATLSDVSPPEIAYSGTIAEYPIIADIDDDGQAEIILAKNPTAWGNTDINGQLAIYKTGNPAEPWAPARKVWNQWAYNSVLINEDMTVPRYSLNPATAFPGVDGVLATSDDVRPYNGFLMQQTMLNKNGMPLWLAPNAIPDQSITSSSVSGNTMSIKIGIINTGDAAIGSPVYVTLYKESSSSGIKMGTGMENIQILPRDTGYVTVTIADITPFLPMVNVVARINDDGTDFPYQGECKDYDNELTLINPALTLMMNKDATLNSVSERGTNPNPVSVLFNEEIEYEITVINANLGSGDVVINDTLPAYLNFVAGSATENITSTPVGGNPSRDLLTWTYPNVASMGTKTVKYKAMPADGVCASQPLFVNRAWVLVSDTVYVETNSTYHQGAGVGIVTFSAGLGGNIYNAEPQAVDYRTSASEGVVVVPGEGYRFAGWSHDGYVSLRGEAIPARKGIMYYDTLEIYGHVDLTALFELEEYPIHYYLNGGYTPADNPTVYTIESGKIMLLAAEKDGDAFVGWTGSNGDIPEPEVCISQGSKGAQTFYANFLYSGREDEKEPKRAENKIWAYKGELYIHTVEAGSVVRIYSTDGILRKLHAIVEAGETSIRLPRGVYIVTINNQPGQKIIIE